MDAWIPRLNDNNAFETSFSGEWSWDSTENETSGFRLHNLLYTTSRSATYRGSDTI